MAIGRGSLARLTLLALLWGSSFLWIAIALRGFSPVQIVLIRLALGALVLVAIVYLRGLRLPSSGTVWLHLTVAALFANAIPYTLFAIGEQHVSSSVAGVLNATTPLWTLVIAFATGHERRISAPKLAGFIVGLAGTLVIFSPWETGSQIASLGGLACLGAAASYGVSYVYMDRFLARRGIPPLVLSAGQLTAATVLLVIVLPFAGLQPIHLRWDAIAALAVLGCLRHRDRVHPQLSPHHRRRHHGLGRHLPTPDRRRHPRRRHPQRPHHRPNHRRHAHRPNRRRHHSSRSAFGHQLRRTYSQRCRNWPYGDQGGASRRRWPGVSGGLCLGGPPAARRATPAGTPDQDRPHGRDPPGAHRVRPATPDRGDQPNGLLSVLARLAPSVVRLR